MQAADKSDAIVVAITRDGRSYLNNNQMPPEDLAPKVKDLLTNRLDKTVYIRSDARAKYEKVVDVVDNLRAAGVDQVGLLTEQIQQDNKKQNQQQQKPAGAAQ
jgi:biopolymer transport protein ExbD/biopolymer transport protein TolR